MNNSSTGAPSKQKAGSSQPSEASLKRKRGVFQKDLQHMMYGFGDDANPLPETVGLLEDIVVEYVTDLVHKAQDVSSKRGKLSIEDFLFLIRKVQSIGQDLELLQAQAKNNAEHKTDDTDESQKIGIDSESSDKLREMMAGYDECSEEDGLMTESDMESDSEALSDIFETDSDTEAEEKAQQPLYLNEFEKFPVDNDEKLEDFDRHLHQISANTAKNNESMRNDIEGPDLDEVDRMFLRAASLLKKKRR